MHGSYTHQGLSGLVSSPETRSGAIKDLVESVGGQIITFGYCFGDYDFVGVFEFPDNTTAASLVMTVASTGSITNAKIAALIPIADGFATAQKASDMTYRAQGQ